MISLDNSKKFIFIHIPKTAGTSIEKALSDYGNITTLRSRHKNAKQFKKELGQEFNNYFKFCVVRNPWARMVSCYFNKRETNTQMQHYYWPFSDWVKYICRKSFLNYIKTTGILQPASIYLNKLYYITDWRGKILVDYIGRFENLQESWEYICSEINVDVNLSRFNSSFHNHYREYYNEETKELVVRKYKKDIEYFGYEF